MACVQKTTDLEKEHVKLLYLLARRKTERETCKSPPPSSHFYHLLPFLLRDIQTLTSLDTKYRWTMKHLQLAPGQTIYTSSGFPSSHTRTGTQQGPAPQCPSVRPGRRGSQYKGQQAQRWLHSSRTGKHTFISWESKERCRVLFNGLRAFEEKLSKLTPHFL